MILNLKTTRAAELHKQSGIYPAYHMNKKYWISIILDDSASTSATSLKYGMRALYDIQAPDRILVTDDVRKLAAIDYDLVSEVLIIGQKPTNDAHKKVLFFTNELDLISHLGDRLDENCLVLLEIPLPEIIDSYLW